MELDRGGLEQLAGRVREALESAGVEASLGWAGRHARRDFPAAQTLADQRMYLHKRGAEASPAAVFGAPRPA